MPLIRFLTGLCLAWFLIFSASSLQADEKDPFKIYFNGGYSNMNIAGNHPLYWEEYVSLIVGGQLQLRLSEKTLLSFNAQVAYAPNRRKLRLKLGTKERIEGEASLRINYYGLTLLGKVADDLYLLFGPALSLNHVMYQEFTENHSEVEIPNKIMFKNIGLTGGARHYFNNEDSYLEISTFWMKRDEYYLVDDTSLDAKKIEEDDDPLKQYNFTVAVSYGMLVF